MWFESTSKGFQQLWTSSAPQFKITAGLEGKICLIACFPLFLQRDGHNIFTSLNAEAYRQVSDDVV